MRSSTVPARVSQSRSRYDAQSLVDALAELASSSRWLMEATPRKTYDEQLI
jgi:hypothetical protein